MNTKSLSRRDDQWWNRWHPKSKSRSRWSPRNWATTQTYQVITKLKRLWLSFITPSYGAVSLVTYINVLTYTWARLNTKSIPVQVTTKSSLIYGMIETFTFVICCAKYMITFRECGEWIFITLQIQILRNKSVLSTLVYKQFACQPF